MRDWVLSLIYSVTGPIRRLAEEVQQRLAVLWGNVTRVFGRIRTAWSRLYQRFVSLRNGILWSAWELYTTLRYWFQVKVPSLLWHVYTNANTWARKAVADALSRAWHWVYDLRRWAIKSLNWLTDSLGKLRTWAVKALGEVWNTLSRTAKRVADLLGDPRRLAEWAAGAMTSAVLRYLHAKREAIGSWLTRRSVAFTLWFARMLDDVIGRIM